MVTPHDNDHFKQERRRLVYEIKEKGITANLVLQAVYTMPRYLFMPYDLQHMAYQDRAFPIGEGQTILQPYTVAYQTQLLAVPPKDNFNNGL